MDHELIKKGLIEHSTHYSGDLKINKWHEMSFIKECHHPEKHQFYYTYKVVRFDLKHYESTGELCFSDDTTYGSELPKNFKLIKNQRVC